MARQPKTQPALVAYVGNALGDHAPFNSCAHQHALTDFHGNRIGVCRFMSWWSIRNSYIGNRMHQIHAIVDGVEYTGRGFGEGMAVALRPRAVKH